MEKEEHYYNAIHTRLLDLGLQPHLLTKETLQSMLSMVERFKDRVDPKAFLATVNWRHATNYLPTSGSPLPSEWPGPCPDLSQTATGDADGDPLEVTGRATLLGIVVIGVAAGLLVGVIHGRPSLRALPAERRPELRRRGVVDHGCRPTRPASSSRQ